MVDLGSEKRPSAFADSTGVLVKACERERDAASAKGGRRPRLDRACRRGYGHRYDRGAAGEIVPGFHAGRFAESAPLRRDGLATSRRLARMVGRAVAGPSGPG